MVIGGKDKKFKPVKSGGRGGRGGAVSRGGPSRSFADPDESGDLWDQPRDVPPPISSSDSSESDGEESGEDVFGKRPPRPAHPMPIGFGNTDDVADVDPPEIETFNPNRGFKKPVKLSAIAGSAAAAADDNSDGEDDDTAGANDLLKSSKQPQLSRREREALEKQRGKEAFWKAQQEGRTDQARADLARLAIIRKQREEAAQRKAAEDKAKDKTGTVKSEALNAGKALLTKTLGKK